ncbi:MAG: NAD-dependent epimerase/dehydratase family protein [Pseudomonadales bacterium]
MKRVFITGGCGFIGANLARVLTPSYQVVVYDNFSRGSPSYVRDLPVEIIEGDILDRESLQTALANSDYVIHLAAFGSVIESLADPMTNFQQNAQGTLNVLEAARAAGTSKVVFASTGGALIGEAEPPVSETSLPKPISPYGASKLVGEGYVHAFARSYGMNTVALRFANVYGPISAHKKGAVTAFIKALFESKPITIFGEGKASRDFLYVDDLCQGVQLALKANLTPGDVLHLASGVETSILELAECIKSAANLPDHPIEFEPPRQGEVFRNFARYDYAHAMLGFEPVVPLAEGIETTFSWFAENREDVLKTEASDA